MIKHKSTLIKTRLNLCLSSDYMINSTKKSMLFLLVMFFISTKAFSQDNPTELALSKMMNMTTTAEVGTSEKFYIASRDKFWIDWGNGTWVAYPPAEAAFFAGGKVKGSAIRIAGESVWDLGVELPISEIDLRKNDQLESLINNTAQSINVKSIDFSGNPKLRVVNLMRTISNRGQLESLNLINNHKLTFLNVANHKLKSLIISKQALRLEKIFMYGNNISGRDMDDFISSLPIVEDRNAVPKIWILTAEGKGEEGNRIYAENMRVAKHKGYQLLDSDNDLVEDPIYLEEKTFLQVGKSKRMTDENETRNITWKSNNTSVATVSQSGEVTAIGLGIATITAKLESGKTAKTIVVVNKSKEGSVKMKIPHILGLTNGEATVSMTDKFQIHWADNDGANMFEYEVTNTKTGVTKTYQYYSEDTKKPHIIDLSDNAKYVIKIKMLGNTDDWVQVTYVIRTV